MEHFGLYIGGSQRPAVGGATFESVDPYTGDAWATLARATAEDVDIAVSCAHTAFLDPTWSALTATERGRLLVRLADLVEVRLDDLVAVESRDNGKSHKELRTALKSMAGWYRYFGGMADKVLGDVIPVDKPQALNYTRYEPYGVVAAILPWNSPLRLGAWKLAPALAAGNTVVLKPSEHTSVSVLVFTELIELAGFPPGVVSIVTGFGPEVVPPLVSHALVRKVSFTGGAVAGSVVGELAAKHTKPCLLELGGKSAQVVFADADLEKAAAGIAAGVFASGGQTCLAGSRLLVHEDVRDDLVELLTARAAALRLGNPADPATDVGPVATATQHKMILNHIERASAQGATRVCGGAPTAGGGQFIEPTIFVDVSPDSDLFKREVFGPVLAVTTFRDEGQAVALSNAVPYGLAAGVWTRDVGRAHRVANEVAAGTVWINSYRNTVPQSPFGGYKDSGIGRESGFQGIHEYLQMKSIWLDLDDGDV